MDTETLRAVAAKMREQNRPPSPEMLIAEYHVAVSLYAFIDALEAVATERKSVS